MRVLHAISGIDPRNGGPTQALVGLTAAQVRAARLDVRVISTWQEDDAHQSAERLRALGVGVRMVGRATGKLSRHPELRSALEAEVAAADVVHVHAVWEEMQHQACRAAQRLGKPYVFTPHGMLDPWNMTKSRLGKNLYLALRMRRNLQWAAALHYTTEIERHAVARMKLRPPTIVEPLGLDVTEFDRLPPPGTFRARHPIIGTRPIILFLGRIHYGKGLEVLVPAVANMKHPDAMLVIAGPDSAGYRATVEQLIARQGLADRVIFTGMVRGGDKLAALVDATVLALPSFHENFGLVVIEALAAGTPVVVSDQVNLHPEVTAAGVGGVMPLDPICGATVLDRWVHDSALRASAAGRAARFVRERYDWNKIALRWAAHYQDVLARRAAGVGL
ncbi:MAG TPA: glycosyltransferase [Tepidisphaeraceae bacterium]|nr:glycosyltransferase [Tepidisphaeraceae bacterium]